MTQQRGVALLTALLVVALASLLLLAMLEVGEDARARTRNVLRAEQAHAYVLGLEAWASALLRRDAEDGPGYDSHASAWVQDLPPIRVPGGELRIRLEDRSGCFNLNSLVLDGQPQPLQVERFERLLEILDLDRAVAAQAVDWIDPDSVPLSGGAEDLQYQLARPAYRAANRPFVHVTELRLLRSVDEASFRRLQPHVCVLPEVMTSINVNMASVELLMALHPAIDAALARRLHQDGRARFASVDAFLAAMARGGIEPGVAEGLVGIDVRTRHVLARADIVLDDLPIAWQSMLRRDATSLAVLWRAQGHD